MNDNRNNQPYFPQENPYQSQPIYYSPYPPPVYGPPAKGLGIAGFVLSLLGLLCCGCLPPLSFGGLIFSIIAMVKGNRSGLAIAGLILGILGSLSSLFLLASFLLSEVTFQEMYTQMPML